MHYTVTESTCFAYPRAVRGAEIKESTPPTRMMRANLVEIREYRFTNAKDIPVWSNIFEGDNELVATEFSNHGDDHYLTFSYYYI
jgi:hypothetical protein